MRSGTHRGCAYLWSPAQDQTSQNSGIDARDDLRAPPLTEEMLAVVAGERESFSMEDVALVSIHPVDGPTQEYIWVALTGLNGL